MPTAPADGSTIVPPSALWLFGMAPIPQVALRVLPADLRHQIGSVFVAISAVLAVSALASVAYRSRRFRVAAALALVGGGLNAAVMLANGGMPVSATAAEHLEGAPRLGDEDPTARHVALDEGTRLAFLADVIPLRLGHARGIASVGDVVLLLAAAATAHSLTRRSLSLAGPAAPEEASAGSMTMAPLPAALTQITGDAA